MAEMRAKDDALLGLTGNHHLTDFERAVTEIGLDHNPVLVVVQGVSQCLAAAQSPVALVILKDERHRVGYLRMNIQMLEQQFTRNDPFERERVRHDMKWILRVREEP